MPLTSSTRLGVGRRDAVSIVSVNCEQLVTALLAAEAVGVAAPINPALAVEHAEHLVKLAGARVIVAAGPSLTRDRGPSRGVAARTQATALLALRPVLATGEAPALEPVDGATVAYLEDLAADAPADGLPAAPPAASDLASYLHTGGTTGVPKLAARTHANEVSNAWMIAASFPADDGVFFAALPLFHTNALLVTLLAPLLRGQHVVWTGPLGYRDPPILGVFWRIVERYRIAAMSGVPTVYSTLLQVPVDADVSSLRYPLVGAAPLPVGPGGGVAGTHGRRAVRGLWPDRGNLRVGAQLPRRGAAGSVGQRLPYQEVRAVRVDEATGAWEPLATRRGRHIVIKGPNVFAGLSRPGPDGPVPDPG